MAPEKFVYCISNHDQIGNRPLADRFHHAISPEAYKAVSLFFCLLPYTPLLFMGQEWGASTPFHFFTDFEGELGKKMGLYRLQEFARLGMEVRPGQEDQLVDPQSDAAFSNSKLRWEELEEEPYRSILAFYRMALALRKELHVGGNPERSNWSVRHEGDVVIVTYLVGTRQVEVHFAVKNAMHLQLPGGEILSRSGTGPGKHPETVVVRRKT